MVRLFGRRASEREQRDELLSAYLDGRLDAETQARLEAQLATDSKLQAELRALRRTVALVRELPQVPVPRNFILPQTAATRPRPARPARSRLAWAAPLFTAATAIVSLLFVLTLVGGPLFIGAVGDWTSEPQPVMLREAGAPKEATEHAPAEEEAQVERAPAAEEPTSEKPAAEEPPTESAGAESYADTATEEAQSPVPAPPTEEPAVAPSVPATATAAVMGEGGAEPTPARAAEAAPPGVDEEESGTANGESVAPESEGAPLLRVTPLLVLEIALGLLSLALISLTILAWRARLR